MHTKPVLYPSFTGIPLERVLLLAILLLLLSLLQSCHNSEAQDSQSAAKVEGNTVLFAKNNTPATVETATVGTATGSTLSLPGRVVWNEDKTVRVYSPLAGRVTSIAVKLGDTVKRGQPLAVLDSPDYGSAQSDYRKAMALDKLAQSALKRAQDLFEHGVIAEKDLQQAESDAATARADADRTERVLKPFLDDGKQIDQHMVLRSPIDGVVVERALNPGQELRPDQAGPPVFVVTDPHDVWIELDATEKEAASLKTGLHFDFHAGLDNSATFSATVFRVSDFVDPVTRTVKILARATNDAGRLKGQMFITSTIGIEQTPTNSVASNSVYLLGDQHFAFVKVGDSFVRREVRIGREHDGLVDVESGLEAGETVVTQGALFLQQIMQTHHG